MPIYHVKYRGAEYLIDAKSTSEAVKHVTRPASVESKPLTASELVQFLEKGFKVEKAGEQ